MPHRHHGPLPSAGGTGVVCPCPRLAGVVCHSPRYPVGMTAATVTFEAPELGRVLGRAWGVVRGTWGVVRGTWGVVRGTWGVVRRELLRLGIARGGFLAGGFLVRRGPVGT